MAGTKKKKRKLLLNKMFQAGVPINERTAYAEADKERLERERQARILEVESRRDKYLADVELAAAEIRSLNMRKQYRKLAKARKINDDVDLVNVLLGQALERYATVKDDLTSPLNVLSAATKLTKIKTALDNALLESKPTIEDNKIEIFWMGDNIDDTSDENNSKEGTDSADNDSINDSIDDDIDRIDEQIDANQKRFEKAIKWQQHRLLQSEQRAAKADRKLRKLRNAVIR